MSDQVLLTGANGFIGRAMMPELLKRRLRVRGVVRPGIAVETPGAGCVAVDLGPETLWLEALRNCQVVLHLAGLVHLPLGRMSEPLKSCRAINVAATLNLARQAAVAGVRRFVFISSIKVNGESTAPGRPFSAGDLPAPQDAYGISKMEAEAGLREIAAATAMEVVVVRPPLVYGPGVKGNFAALMRWVARGLPLPLGAIDNRRSFVALDNLVDLLALCVDHPAAANKTFLVSDGEDLSTPDLLRRVGMAMGRPVRLVTVPANWLRWGASALGKGEAVSRLCGSLQVNMTSTHEALGWSPPIGVDEGLRRAARPFLAKT